MQKVLFPVSIVGFSTSGIFERLGQGRAIGFAGEAVSIDAHAHRGDPFRGPRSSIQRPADDLARVTIISSTKDSCYLRRAGNPIGFHLTPGEAHDLAGADVLLAQLPDETGR